MLHLFLHAREDKARKEVNRALSGVRWRGSLSGERSWAHFAIRSFFTAGMAPESTGWRPWWIRRLPTVGIMPLADGEWERGKCSYKMLQYMACGVPVVVSPVGMNAQILALGEVGLAAVSNDEWVEALRWILAAGREVRDKMGQEGRRVAETYFSVEVIAPRLAQVLKGLV